MFFTLKLHYRNNTISVTDIKIATPKATHIHFIHGNERQIIYFKHMITKSNTNLLHTQ